MTDAQAADLRGRRVLVVEDDYIIASDLAFVLEDRGVEVIGPAPSVEEALKLIAEVELDGAMLDINLGKETSYPIADALTKRDVPFIFVTGYDVIVVPTAHADVPRLEKPIRAETLAHLLADTIGGLANALKTA